MIGTAGAAGIMNRRAPVNRLHDDPARRSPIREDEMARKSRATRLGDACAQIQDGISEVEALRDEIQEWHDGMEGTNLEHTAKYEELGECLESLESGLGEIESAIGELEGVSFPGMY